MDRHQDEDETERDPLATGASHSGDDDAAGEPRVRAAAQRAVQRASSAGSAGWKGRLSGLPGQRVLPVVILLAGIVIVALIAYLITARTDAPAPAAAPPAAAPSGAARAPSSQASPPATARPQESEKELPGLSGLLGTEPPDDHVKESWPVVSARITLKLALAALLAALLAFRPRRDMPSMQRNPYVAQTQILLAVVASALMLIVADNAARAFGIFAAASLVRFRTNIRDPKEITVLLMSLGIGLASGVGKVEVAIILSLFGLLVLSLLEYFEPEQVFRAMELTVTSRKVEDTDEMLREMFEKRNMSSELRKVDREDPENPLGKIVYHVNVGSDLSTDKLSDEIFSSDPENIDSIQWDQKKVSSYVYR